MELLAGANITGLNHTLSEADNTISTLQAGNPRESTQNREFLIVYTNYWYRTT